MSAIRLRLPALVRLTATLIGAGWMLFAQAQGPQAVVDHAWIRALPGDLPAAGYFTLRNKSDKPLVLTGAESDTFGSVMLHRTTKKDGIATMTMQHEVDVPAHGVVEFSPGGLHLMLMHAKHPLSIGGSASITLHFAGGDSLSQTFAIRPPGSTGP